MFQEFIDSFKDAINGKQHFKWKMFSAVNFYLFKFFTENKYFIKA